MSAQLKFLNDIVKPWDELNALLIEQYAFQPDLSDVTTRVTALSNVIKHQVDILALERGCRPKKVQQEIDAESEAARMISDVSDAAKHLRLADSKRQNSIFVASMFEVNSEGFFRFLRNGVFVDHATLGRRDFMQIALVAIEYWSRKRQLDLAWSGKLGEAGMNFFPTAFLHFNPKYCINMSSAQIMFFSRDEAGNLNPFDPEVVQFEIR